MAKTYYCNRCGEEITFRSASGTSFIDGTEGKHPQAPRGGKQVQGRDGGKQSAGRDGGRRIVPIHPNGPCKAV